MLTLAESLHMSAMATIVCTWHVYLLRLLNGSLVPRLLQLFNVVRYFAAYNIEKLGGA